MFTYIHIFNLITNLSCIAAKVGYVIMGFKANKTAFSNCLSLTEQLTYFICSVDIDRTAPTPV